MGLGKRDVTDPILIFHGVSGRRNEWRFPKIKKLLILKVFKNKKDRHLGK